MKICKKFSCFFSRDIFQNLFKYGHNKNENDKKEVMRNIEDIFYSKIDNSWKIDRIKREKLIKMKKINKKYINNLEVLNCGREKQNYFKYYDLNIYDNLDEIENELDKEIMDQKEVKRKKDKRSREIRRQIQEEEERRRPIPLKRCPECKDICLFYHGKISQNKPGGSYMYLIHVYKAHKNCI